jgi:hypothetical protein
MRVVPQIKHWCFRPVPKILFPTIAAAERAAVQMIARGQEPGRELVVFFCEIHQNFHLGHMPRRESR